jgi:hypothetical protein
MNLDVPASDGSNEDALTGATFFLSVYLQCKLEIAMRRFLAAGLGLVGILGTWACSSSSDSGNGVNDSSGDGGTSTTTDGGSSAIPDGGSSGSDGSTVIPKGDGGVPGAVIPWAGTISATGSAGCALATGGIYCWQENNDGTASSAVSLDPLDFGNSSAVAHFVGTRDEAAPLSDGGFFSVMNYVGIDKSGEMLAQGTEFSSEPNAVRIASQLDGQECVLDSAGTVTCFGGGDEDGSGVANPDGSVTVALPKKAIDVSTPRLASCALLESGEVYCWGATPIATGSSTATKVDLGGALAVRLSENVASQLDECAILTTGTVRCWGHDVIDWGGTAGKTFDIAHLAGAVSVSIGFNSDICGLMTDGSVKCIDDNGVASDPVIPEKIVELSAGLPYVARAVSGAVYRWPLGKTVTKITLP